MTMPTENCTRVLVKMDCYPSKSPIVLRWLAEAFTQTGIQVLEANAGEKYMFGCWDAWLTIPEEVHTKENEARAMEALQHLYETNNPDDIHAPEPLLIRGMILEWEGKDDAN